MALSQRVAWDASPAWSPDGTRLAFASNCLAAGCNAAVSDLWVINADGPDARQLTFGTAIDDDAYSPAWSPDGQWIAFDMSRNGVRDVYRMRRSGTDLQRLTSGTRIASFLQPSYSPDGLHLACITWAGPDTVTHLLNASPDGADAAQLPLAVGEAVDPSWSR